MQRPLNKAAKRALAKAERAKRVSVAPQGVLPPRYAALNNIDYDHVRCHHRGYQVDISTLSPQEIEYVVNNRWPPRA